MMIKLNLGILAAVLFTGSLSMGADLAELKQTDILSSAVLDAPQPDGRWLGPNWWANRLHDWRTENSAFVCEPNRSFLGWRTAHDLTRDLNPDIPLRVQVTVTLRPETEGDLSPTSLAGFLLAGGHTLADPRARAMVFDFAQPKTGWPAIPGSGFALGISGRGTLRIVDLDTGKVPAQATIRLQPNEPVTLTLTSVPHDQQIKLQVRAEAKGRTATVATMIPRQRVRQGIALLSHPGRADKSFKSLVSTFSDYTVTSGFSRHNAAAQGPVALTQYTVNHDILKLSAQCFPQPEGTRATLSFYRDGRWEAGATETLHPIDQAAYFRLTGWDRTVAVPFRVTVPVAGSAEPAGSTGLITANPTGNTLRLGVLGCVIHRPWGTVSNWKEDLYFPHHDLEQHAAQWNPDAIFFYGDQMYEGTPSYVDRKNYHEDYLYKWLFHCVAFRETVRDVPSITIPDDHDLYQGNHWGEGCRPAPNHDHNFGGYEHPGAFVAQVHRSQTAHLPDPYEPDCLEQDIPAYHCEWVWGGVSFAIVGDRSFKSGPAGHGLPESGTQRPDHYNNPDFDTAGLDLPGLQLLGEPQERFLRHWAANWSRDTQLKVLLSQSPFGNLATHHAGDYLIADLDSNGWPQSGRNRALRILRSARAPHIAGDQHLSTLVQHGIDRHGDAVFGFCGPAVANAYARAYYPGYTGPYYQTPPPQPGQYLGERLDGFKNKVTFRAVANPDTTPEGPYTTTDQPRLHQQVPGFGIVDFDLRTRTTTFNSIPRSPRVAAKLPGGQYPGWPITIRDTDNDGRPPVGELGRITVTTPHLQEHPPLIRVYQSDGTLEYAQRTTSPNYIIHAFTEGTHTIQILDDQTVVQTWDAEPVAKAPSKNL